jgi:hypothetical protein
MIVNNEGRHYPQIAVLLVTEFYNCGFFYNKKWLYNITIGGGLEFTQKPTSQFSSEPRSTRCANFTVKAESLFYL